MIANEILGKVRGAQANLEEGVSNDASLRFVLEAEREVDETQLESAVADALNVVIDLSPLFGGPQKEEVGQDKYDNTIFFLLVIPGVSFREIDKSPFELAYFLRSQLSLVSVEPDIEAEFFNGADINDEELNLFGGGSDESPPLDRAWALRMIRTPEAWAHSESDGNASRGAGVLIGHPDTGVNSHDELSQGAVDTSLGFDFVDNKPDPTDPLIKNWFFDNVGHGIATSSVIASRGGVNSIRPGEQSGTLPPGLITGSAPESVVVPIRAINTVVRVTQSTVAKSIDHARIKGLHVISMSLGGLPSRALYRSIRRAVSENIIVVAAAGNRVHITVYPARYDECIAVAGVTFEEKPWSGSSRGASVDFSAPAENVYHADRRQSEGSEDKIAPGKGTSYAVALSAGVAALWLSHYGRKNLIQGLAPGTTLQDQFRYLVRASAHRPDGWDSNNFGAGILDAEKLLKSVVDASLGSFDLEKRDESIWSELVKDMVNEATSFESMKESVTENPFGLSKQQLDRYGLEIIWLMYKKKNVQLLPGSQSALEGAFDIPSAIASSELRSLMESIDNRDLDNLLQ